jgi:hypothetical protein
MGNVAPGGRFQMIDQLEKETIEQDLDNIITHLGLPGIKFALCGAKIRKRVAPVAAHQMCQECLMKARSY